MGDVVIHRGGQQLRFTHRDFLLYGDPDTVGQPFRQISFTGEIPDGFYVHRIAVNHTADVDREEERYQGHNAHLHDMLGMMQLFASTRDQRSAEGEMLLPDGSRCRVVHEWGQGTVDGEFQVALEELSSGRVLEKGDKSVFRRFFRRNEG